MRVPISNLDAVFSPELRIEPRAKVTYLRRRQRPGYPQFPNLWTRLIHCCARNPQGYPQGVNLTSLAPNLGL